MTEPKTTKATKRPSTAKEPDRHVHPRRAYHAESYIFELADRYCEQHAMTFAELNRMALLEFLVRRRAF